jgi:hypothetical protein
VCGYGSLAPSLSGKSVVNMHCFDDLEKCHLVSKFSCIPQAGSVLVRYEEATSSAKIAVKIAQNKIRKAHQYVLTLVAAQVAKNAHLSAGSQVSADKDGKDTLSSQRSNTDAIQDATTTPSDQSDDVDEFRDGEDEPLMELVTWEDLPLEAVRERIMKPAPGSHPSLTEHGFVHFSMSRRGRVGGPPRLALANLP